MDPPSDGDETFLCQEHTHTHDTFFFTHVKKNPKGCLAFKFPHFIDEIYIYTSTSSLVCYINMTIKSRVEWLPYKLDGKQCNPDLSKSVKREREILE